MAWTLLLWTCVGGHHCIVFFQKGKLPTILRELFRSHPRSLRYSSDGGWFSCDVLLFLDHAIKNHHRWNLVNDLVVHDAEAVWLQSRAWLNAALRAAEADAELDIIHHLARISPYVVFISGE